MSKNEHYRKILNECTEEGQLAIVERFYDLMLLIENPSKRLQIDFIKKHGHDSIKYIGNPCKEAIIECFRDAAKNNRYFDSYLKYVGDDLDLQFLAIHMHFDMLEEMSKNSTIHPLVVDFAIEKVLDTRNSWNLVSGFSKIDLSNAQKRRLLENLKNVRDSGTYTLSIKTLDTLDIDMISDVNPALLFMAPLRKDIEQDLVDYIYNVILQKHSNLLEKYNNGDYEELKMVKLTDQTPTNFLYALAKYKKIYEYNKDYIESHPNHKKVATYILDSLKKKA